MAKTLQIKGPVLEMKGLSYINPRGPNLITQILILRESIPDVSFPDGSVVKNLPSRAGDMGSIPRSGRCHGEGNGNPLQYSCLENSRQEEPSGLWGPSSPWGHKELDTTE